MLEGGSRQQGLHPDAIAHQQIMQEALAILRDLARQLPGDQRAAFLGEFGFDMRLIRDGCLDPADKHTVEEMVQEAFRRGLLQ